MDPVRDNFYFIRFGEVIRGPYPIGMILDFFRTGKANVYTLCSADKRQWENLGDLFRRLGVEYATVEHDLAIKPESPPPEVTPSSELPASMQARAETAALPVATAVPIPLFSAVLGLLWHPGAASAQLAGRAGKAFGIALAYQIVFAVLVTAGRGFLLLHRAAWWKLLWFAPVSTLSTLTAVFAVIGGVCLIFRTPLPDDDGIPGTITGGTMICGTWAMTLFALLPVRFCPWNWCEWLAIVFLGFSFAWFAAMMAELTVCRAKKTHRCNRYVAAITAILMLLGITAIHFYLIYLYKEF